jgi:glutathione peroxidase
MSFKNIKLKRVGIVLLLGMIAITGYVQFVNRNSKNMTSRQKVLKTVYPLWIGLTRIVGSHSRILTNTENKVPVNSIYDLKVTLNNGEQMPLAAYRGKKILFVNTASDCGYTPQYEALEKLFMQNGDKLVVFGFPANDFKEQEKGNDEEIAAFCKLNFGVSFPLAKKSTVVKKNGQNEVFQWLSKKDQNGWNDQEPTWNFSKYLVDENGSLTNYFDPSISPMSKEIIEAVRK